MTRCSRYLLPLLFASACSPTAGAPVDAPRREEDFIGGWDGAQTRGVSVLLLREGLIGSLSATRLGDATSDFQLSYAVDGDVTDDGIMLELTCADARSRTLADPDDDDGVPGPWSSIDCAGWEIALDCSLAGSCGGDCNMICDVMYFGDAYASAGVSLSTVEDEFDYWERV